VAGEAQREVAFHVGPLRGKDAEHHRVASRAIASRLVMPQHTILLRAEGGDRALRCRVEAIGAKADDLAA
jgi:hypothetical protein